MIQDSFPNVNETIKIHNIKVHLKQWIKKDGEFRGLAEFSEQELEASHQSFDKIWRRLKVNDIYSPKYLINKLKAVAIFNRHHA